MEFPHLGQHCSEPTCNRLDFLPVKCDSCSKVFCSGHYNYQRHSCPGAYKKDVQVPICPLCGEPVPTAPGVEPDLTVGQHIDKQCKSDTKKIFTNRCSHKGCKRAELVPIQCSQCRLNFCLRHRHFSDHNCQAGSGGAASTSAGKSSATKKAAVPFDTRAMAANAAEYRRSNKPTTLDVNPQPPTVAAAARQRAATSHVHNIQGNMTEDEALARALALSIMELDESADRNRRDAADQAANNNANNAATTTQRVPVGSGKDKCSLS